MTQKTKTLPPFWHRTPPAVFPCLLGFLGLGSAWRRAGNVWEAIPAWIGEALLLIAAVIFIGAFLSYLAKLCLRPSVIFDDLKVAPARGAVTAGAMCWMLIAGALIPYNLEVAQVIWGAALVLQLAYLILVIHSIWQSGLSLSSITPVIMLPFVGFIVAATFGVPMGFVALSKVMLIVTFPFYIAVLWLSFRNIDVEKMPPPVRASYAIILAPPTIYGIAGASYWGLSVFIPFWIIAVIGFVVGLTAWRWLTAGGWNPGWGAFTFPLTSFASIMIDGAALDYSLILHVFAAAALVLASLVVPVIVYRTLKFWAIGKLAQATGAATV